MRSDQFQIDLLGVATLTLWSACLLVGVVDHFVIVSVPRGLALPRKPTEVTLASVSLTDLPAAAEAVVQMPSASVGPKPPEVTAISPAIEFAVPVEGPVRLVPREHVAVVPTKAKVVPTFKQVSFGTGEGNQPKPEYPIEAQLDGQDGTIDVQFVVAEDGRVISTEVTRPCKWPLLNQAAQRSIRDNWSYPAGPVRYLKVSIIYRQKH